MATIGREGILGGLTGRTFTEVVTRAGTVRLRSMSEGEKRRYQSTLIGTDGKPKKAGMEQSGAALLALSICDESGDLVFTELDVPRLLELNAGDSSRLVEAAQRLNGMGDQEEDPVKNSEATGDA